MDLARVLQELGGVASRRHLLRAATRVELDRAISSGQVVRVARGRYVLPSLDEARQLAHRHHAVVSYSSAAALHGWEVCAPPLPHLTVPRHRKVPPALRARACVHYADLDPQDIHDGITGRQQTLLDCLRLRRPEALCVADSALRHGAITEDGLHALARSRRGAGAARARAIAQAASPLSANPFESVLRAISLEVPGLGLQPQRDLFEQGRWLGRPDLSNAESRVVVEAESHSFHSRRGDLRRDCQRYTAMVLAGWTVVRFAWEDVMFEPDYVRRQLTRLRDLTAELAEVAS